LLVAGLGLVFGDESLLVPATIRGGVDEKLSVACVRERKGSQVLLADLMTGERGDLHVLSSDRNQNAAASTVSPT